VDQQGRACPGQVDRERSAEAVGRAGNENYLIVKQCRYSPVSTV
jgi:hypothetical protein